MIPLDSIIITKHIATGSFGRVSEGSIRGVDGRVAVKELNDMMSLSDLKVGRLSRIIVVFC